MARKIIRESQAREKKLGDVWYTIEAPEELHYWSSDFGWDRNLFKKKGASLVAINVKNSETICKLESQKYDLRNPLHLRKCGIDITDGYVATTTQSRVCRFLTRVDGVTELNSALEELSEMHQVKMWRILNLDVYHEKSGDFSYFKLFNPNGVGDTLALYKVMVDGKKKSYSEVGYSVLDNIVKSFRKEVIGCAQLNGEPKLETQCAFLHRKQLAQLKSKEKIIK